MRVKVSFATYAILCLLVSCKPTVGLTVYGIVTETDGKPIVNAHIRVVTANSEVPAEQGETDSQGAFRIQHAGRPNDLLSVSVSHPRYARVIRPFTFTKAAALFTLRPLDYAKTVMLPTAGDAPINLSTHHANGLGVTLSIPPDSMVLPDGSVAHGEVSVKLTYWGPKEDLATSPGLLYGKGEDPNYLVGNSNNYGLATLGMADIEIVQADQELQVRSGSSLTLQMTASPEQRSVLGNPNVRLPNLYSLDPNSAVWSYEGNASDGMLAYDIDSSLFTAKLKHLSDWNIDAGLYDDRGGCVQTVVVDACDSNRVLGNQDVNMYMYNVEEIAIFSGKSGPDGSLCINIPYMAYDMMSNNTWVTQQSSSPYYLTGANPNDSIQCNPAPDHCMQCISNPSLEHLCSDCRYWPENTGPGTFGGVTYFNDGSCDPLPSALIVACHWCPGSQLPAFCRGENQSNFMLPMYMGGCTQLPVAKVPGPNCQCDGKGHCGSCPPGAPKAGETCSASRPCCGNASCVGGVCAPNTTDTCAAILPQGSPCQSDSCCAPGLICNDRLCVPAHD